MVPNGMLANSNGYNENAGRSAYRRSGTNNRDQVMMRPDGRCFVVARSGHSGNGYHGAANNSETDEQPVSRTYQYRKVMKPMLERKRRARINRCLDELKEIMLTALQAEGENVSKLEKADILELTVRHLHKLKRQRAFGLALPGHAPSVGNADEPSSNYVDRFRAGFTHCAAEVSQYLASAIQEQQQQQQQSNNKTSPADPSAATVPPAVGAFGYGDKFLIDHTSSMKLLQHLSYCIQRIESAASCRDESYHRPSANFYSTPPSSPSPNEKMLAGAASPHGSSVWRPW